MFASTAVLSDATLLFVVDRPVDRLPIPVDAEVDSELTALVTPEMPVLSDEIPVDAEVDNDESPVLNDETPVLNELATVDSDDTPVLKLETAVDVDVLNESTAWFVALSCEPFTASVLSGVSCPAATFVI
nr:MULTISPECIES: hypothetical protein [unclassified Burkholderia]